MSVIQVVSITETATASAPCLLPSVANLREHWSKRARRAKAHRSLGHALTLKAINRCYGKEFVVTVIRVAPRKLDSHDNLRSALKGVVDGVADALGVKDDDPTIKWSYEQEKGKPAVKIELRFIPLARASRPSTLVRAIAPPALITFGRLTS